MSIKIVSFNARCDVKGDGINYFFNRSGYIREKILKEKPDIIGFQETTGAISKWLKTVLPDYSFYGLGRNADLSGESNLIALRKETVDLFSLDQFWLSPDMRVPGSRYENQSHCPRICVDAVVFIKESKKFFRFYNTHLDHISEEARFLGMQSIIERIKDDKKQFDLPIALTGDMNASPSEKCILSVLSIDGIKLKDASEASGGTFHGYGKCSYKIDYIFTDENADTHSLKLWDDSFEGIYLSDHYPVEITYEI